VADGAHATIGVRRITAVPVTKARERHRTLRIRFLPNKRHPRRLGSDSADDGAPRRWRSPTGSIVVPTAVVISQEYPSARTSEALSREAWRRGTDANAWTTCHERLGDRADCEGRAPVMGRSLERKADRRAIRNPVRRGRRIGSRRWARRCTRRGSGLGTSGRDAHLLARGHGHRRAAV
jgi:hypothetical protein